MCRTKLYRAAILVVLAGLITTAGFAANEAPQSGDQAQPATGNPSDQAQPAKGYPHDGSIRDVDAIGNRNVGCDRGLGNWYSMEKQVAMGKSYAQQVEHTAKMINDPVVTEYVNRVGQNIVRSSDSRVPFTIKVIDSNEINAFALPGGFFFVNSGLLLAADNEAELAGVMAHETGHVAACHAARGQTRGQLASLATIPLIFVPGGYGVWAAEQAGMSLAVPVAFLKFSRDFEAQADYLGVQYLYKAGYDPQAFVAFFEKIEAKEKSKPGTLAKTFETHPPTPDRMQKAQEEIATILPPREQYIVDTSEFEDVKARLAAIENGHKMLNKKDDNQPSLRRTQQKSQQDGQGQDGDDRPTLKRRDD